MKNFVKMMKKSAAAIVALTLGTSNVQAGVPLDEYDVLWGEVAHLQEKGQPKSAIEVAEKIYKRAEKENNFGQQLKAGLSIMAMRQDISTDSVVVDVKKLEAWPVLQNPSPGDEPQTKAQRALTHALIASVYQRMLRSSLAWQDDEAKASFEAKMAEHIEASLTERDQLLGVNVEAYAPLYSKGSDSQFYENDALSLLMDFLENQGMVGEEQLWELRCWCADSYQAKGMRDAYILQKLQALQKQRNLKKKALRLSTKDYYAQLKEIYENNLDTEAAAEACYLYLKSAPSLTDQERYDLAEKLKTNWEKASVRGKFGLLQESLLRPALSAEFLEKKVAGKPFPVVIAHRNVKTAQIVTTIDPESKAMKQFDKSLLPEPVELSFDYQEGTCEPTKYDTIMMTLPAGEFRIMAKSGESSSYDYRVRLTSLQLTCISLPEEGNIACVVDAITGKPIQGCEVISTWEERVKDKWETKTETYKTDAQGQAHISIKTHQVKAQLTPTDATTYMYASYSMPDSIKESKQEIRYRVYTDRAIYRPGQTVHVSGLVYTEKDDERHAVGNRQVEVTLYDANYQEVEKKTVTTDDFGTGSCDFILPTDRLNGKFQVQFGKTSEYIQVEEYKRPTYTVEFEPVKDNFALGDTIDLCGYAKTYSGVPVQGATVKYTTMRSEATFRSWWYRDNRWEETANGEVVTDENGRFTIRMVLQNENDAELLLFRTDVDVTDQAGESHSNSKTIRISKQEFALSISLRSNVEVEDKKTANVTVNASNSQGQPVEVKGTWRLLSYNRVTKEFATEVANGNFTSDKEFTLPHLANLPLGTYRFEAHATDGKGNDIEDSDEFVLWSSKRKEEMNLKKDWVYVPSSTFNEESPIDIWYATAEDDAYTYLYMTSYDHVTRKEIGTRSRTICHQRIECTDEYRNGVAFLFTYAKNSEWHEERRTFSYTAPYKYLKFAWKTFRDKLTPGQEETWTLSILDSEGKPVPAQLLATMYDASLDAFVTHGFPFSLWRVTHSPDVRLRHSNLNSTGTISIRFPSTSLSEFYRNYNRLQPYSHYVELYQDYRFRRERLNAGGRLLRSAAKYDSGAVLLEDAAPMANLKMAVADGEASEEAAVEPAAEAPKEPETNKVRENFNETAFFYPNLLTDKDGNVTISFTLPESLTKWKFLGLAHTKDMYYNTTSEEIIASKDFMVQPNMPRFVRMNDQLTITSRVINQCEKTVSGTAQMRLIDPQTDAVVYTSEVPFSVEAGKTSSVSFDYQVPETYPMLICEVTGTGGGFIDGERNWLPVLTDKKFITETVPFYFLGNETEKDIDLSTLFNNNSSTATQRSMTFEYTDNPSWTAVLALHAVVNPENDNAIAWSAALYANRVAQHLATRMPRLQGLIEQWKNEKGEETTLQSELEKNKELKEILLQETPWVLDAQQETKQRQMICQLFDKDLLDQRILTATEKLQKWQFSNGGWGWYEGMKHNYYTTLAVVSDLAMLNDYLISQDIHDKEIEKMLHKGIKYLDTEELKDYKEFYKKHKKVLPAESTCQYLYAKAISHADTDSKSVAAMKKDYLNRMERNINELTMYGRANTAVILLANGRTAAGTQFVRSLREYTVQKAGVGRYFDTERAYYSWRDYKLPTHIAAMKAMKLTASTFADSQDYLLQMQMWLLRQKQVQTWDNEMNTIAAVDLLLTISPEATFHEVRTPQVTMGTSPLTLNAQTAGIGYTKTPVPADIVASQPQTLHVSIPSDSEVTTTPLPLGGGREGASISWGCVYGQCLESQSKLAATEGELRIERKTYVERVIDGQTQWVALNEGESLSVGDKIRMRHIITADRDLDFVQVRSQHAACLEPLRTLSGYQQMGGRGCYLVLHDASADLLFDRFTKGTATLDLDLYVTHPGTYQQGVATIQCAYAPAFSGHSSGATITVKGK